MNITHPNVQSFEFESTRSIDSGVEAIVFEIAEVWFGISLTKVEQIIDCTNNRSDLNILTKIEILDLHELLFGTKLLAPAALDDFHRTDCPEILWYSPQCAANTQLTTTRSAPHFTTGISC